MNIFQLEQSFVKTIIADTIETYSGQWRLVHEALQNAHDHIQLNPNIKEGSIEVYLSVASNRVTVKDNGTGIDINKFSNIFLIGGTDKGDAHLKKILKGSQGVGIKSTLFTSTLFRVDTVYSGQAWDYELTDSYKFKDAGFNQEIEAPKPKPSSSASGTVFSYSLSDYSVQDFINDVVRDYCAEVKVDAAVQSVATSEEFKTVLETYFRTRTYLGCVRALLGTGHLKPVQVKIVIDFDSHDPQKYVTLDTDYCQFFSNEELYDQQVAHQFPAKYLDFLEIHSAIKRGEKVERVYEDFKEVLRNPPAETQKKLLIQKFDKEAIKDILGKARKNPQTLTVEFQRDEARIKKHKATLEYVNGMYLVISQKAYLLKYFHVGAQQSISVNGLPTSIPLSTPIGGLAYLNNLHLVLDANVTLGFGKRNLHPRHKGALDALYKDIWNMLRRIAPLVVGYREGGEPSETARWNEVEEFENYRNPKNKFRESKLSLKITPTGEQELIALFFELLGRGYFDGYFPFRMGTKTVYDGLFYIDKRGSKTIPQNIRASQLLRVEFKSCLSQLLVDIDQERKFLNEIDLLICWTNDLAEQSEELATDYSVHTLARDDLDPYPGAQWRLKRRQDSCQVLILSEFLETQKLI